MTRNLVSMLALALALSAISLPLALPNAARADTDLESQDPRTVWQDSYRLLLHDAAMLEQDAKTWRENYARANRRNYPRGGARLQYILNADSADKELAKVKQEIERVTIQARRDAIPPFWIYEVDDEPIVLSPPASASGEEEVPEWDRDEDSDWEDEDFAADVEDQEDDREGRNPLYFRD